MENDMIAKCVYVGECAGSHSMGRQRKRWSDAVNECLGKRFLDVRQARRMVQDRSEWRGFVRGMNEAYTGRLTLTRYHSCRLQ